MKKRALSLLLILAMLLPCLPFGASAAEGSPYAGDDGVVKVLAIGNSFTKDSFFYFDQVEKAQDPDDQIKMVVGYLYQGGVPVQTHADNAVNSTPAYIYYKYDRTVSDEWKETPDATTLTALADVDWELISIQMTAKLSSDQGKEEGLDTLVDFIRKNATNPKMKLGRHFTWSYRDTYRFTGPYKPAFVANYGGSNVAMYQDIVAFAQDFFKTRTDFEFFVPAATVIQNLRASILGDNLQRDSYHLNPYGRTMISYAWYRFLTDRPLDSIKLSKTYWNPSAHEREAMMEAINNAFTNPYAVTAPAVTGQDPRPVYFLLEPLADKGGGEVKAYDANNPTQIVTVKYTGRKNSAHEHLFARLNDDGVLEAQTVYNWAPVIGYHNYFQNYDPATATMILADGTAALGGHTGTASCGFTCTPSTKNGGRELSNYVIGIPAATPVVDITGEDHGLKTLQDIIDQSATHRVRLNSYSYDATAPKALFVDEVVPLTTPTYELQEGDVVFIPGTAALGAACEAYIMNSATANLGDRVSVTIPSNAPKATGHRGNTVGRFWEMKDGQLKIINSMWYTNKKVGDPTLAPYRYGYHDRLVDYSSDYILLEQHPLHLGGKALCGWAFSMACGADDSRGGECALRLTVNDKLKILDLRAEVLAGLVAPVARKSDVHTLCVKTDGYMVNTFVPDGTKEGGTAAAIILLDSNGFLTRGEAIRTLYEKAGRPEPAGTAAFTDVPEGSAHYDAVRWAAGKGYIAGYGDGTFGVNDNITVEQLAVILWKYMGCPEDDANLTEIGPHSLWALGALHWAVGRRIFAEIPYNEVGDQAPRIETVKMLNDYLK